MSAEDDLENTRQRAKQRDQDWLAFLGQQRNELRRVALRLTLAVATLTIAVSVGALVLVGQVREGNRQASRADDTARELASVQSAQARSRRLGLVDACEGRNAISRGIRQFVGAVSPQLSPRVRHDFPLERSCEQYAARILANRPPRK